MHKFYQNKKWLCRIVASVSLFIFSGFLNTSFAQCPQNIDFEDGTFSGWVCWTGTTYVGPGGNNVIDLTPSLSGPVAGRHTMLSSTPGNGMDPFGQFPRNCPNGSGHSIQLGNQTGGHEAEGVSYTFTIPATQNEFDLIFHYAVVFQGPPHQKAEQPRLVISVENLTDGTSMMCDAFDLYKDPNQTTIPGFFLSTTNNTGTPVWCKDWSALSIKLDGNPGKTFRIFVKTADCTFNAHFGYAYIDVNTECSSAFVGANFCADDTAVNVVAPYGYQGYTWYNNNFTQVLGNSQILHLSPPPAAGTDIKAVVTPYSIYGCVDTFTAHLLDTLSIHPFAGRDTTFCNNTGASSTQLGTNPVQGFVYSWSPPFGLSNPNISNPVASPVVSTQYILTVRHDGGGCLATDTVNVNVVNLDTTLTVNGSTSICSNSPPVTLHVNLPADSIQWYLNGSPISGANLPNYTVTQTGDYSCTLFSSAGCQFNTRVQHIEIYQSPVASFSVSSNDQCYEGNIIGFVNTSTPPSGTPVYLWRFGDGNTSGLQHPTHSYAAPGTFTVWMYISGDGGCIDSASTVITIRPSVKAGFKIDNATQCFKNNRFVFTDTSRITNGAGTIAYTWDFGDGNTSSQQSPTHSYATTGTFTVKLFTDVGGNCDDQVSYPVTVNPSPVAGFTVNKQNQCYKGNLYDLKNTSAVSTGTLIYNWDLGDGTVSTDADVIHSYSKAGSYTVKMKVSTPEGCSDSVSMNFIVYPNPKADFSVNDICVNLPVPVSNKTVNNTTSTLNYLWDFGNGVTSTSANPTYSYPVAGTYDIMLQVSSAQCPAPPDTLVRTIVVDAPVKGITYPVIDAVILFPEPLQARNIGTSVLWTPATSLDNPRIYKPHFEGKDPVLYKIQLKTPTGCITIDTQFVKTHKKIEIYVPTAFMPGGANMYLRPLCMGIAKVNYFRIYDRWGNLLFQMASDKPGWNGRTGNQMQEIQSVVWMIEAIDVDGNIHHRQGTTVLLH